MFVESTHAKVVALETASRKSTFVAACKEIVKSAESNEDVVALGLEGSAKLKCSVEWFNKKVESLYAEVVDGAVREKKEDDKRTSVKVKEHQVDEEMTRLEPAEVIGQYVDKRIKDMFKKSGDDMEYDDDETQVDKTREHLKLVLQPHNAPKNDYGGFGAPRGPKAPEIRRRWGAAGKGKGYQPKTTSKGMKGAHAPKGGGKGSKGSKSGGSYGASKGRSRWRRLLPENSCGICASSRAMSCAC